MNEDDEFFVWTRADNTALAAFLIAYVTLIGIGIYFAYYT